MKKALTIIVSIILWLIIILAAIFAFTTLSTKDVNNVADIFGYTPLTVQSDSMSPTFDSGDMIIIKKCDPATLQVGDIVTFHTIIQNQYALNTHRIQDIELLGGTVRQYTTKGDNNQLTDGQTIADADIVGKYVTRIAGFGKLIDFMSSAVGFILIIVLPILIFFVYEVIHLINVSIQLKKAVALEAAQEAAQASNTANVSDEVAAKTAELEARLAEAEAKLAAVTKLSEENKTE